MAFVIDAIPSIKRNIEILVPNGVDETKQCDVTVEFRYMPRDERKALQKKLTESGKKYRDQLEKHLTGERKKEPEPEYDDLRIMSELTLGIEGLVDAEGNDVPYTPELLPTLMNLDYFATRIGKELNELIWGAGFVAAMEKNSQTPATTG